MQNLAAEIEASYRRLGISHFHDGFVHLVRREGTKGKCREHGGGFINEAEV